jgi:SAM-dependent methyltransferase
MRDPSPDTSIVDRPVDPALPAPPIDFGKAATDYARHRQGFPPRFYAALSARGIGRAGQRVVDLGTGTGTVARALAARGCDVTGVDLSDRLLAQAAVLAADDGVRVDWRHAAAEDTKLPAGGYDVVTSAASWHWFDRPRAIAEVRRLLAPGGRLVIAHLDWIDEPGVVGDTLRLIERHRGAPMPVIAGLDGFYPAWPRELRAAGVTRLEYAGFDDELVYTQAAWCGRIRASAFVGGSMEPEQLARFDAEHAALLAARHPDPLRIPHRIFTIIAEVTP